MGSPAPASNDTDSGSGKTACGIAATTSPNPPRPGNAATRSPAEKPDPSGADRTMPATSEPGVNGNGGLIWYSPRLCSTSGNVTPAAWTSMRTIPSPEGSSTSTTSSADGPSRLVICTARMAETLVHAAGGLRNGLAGGRGRGTATARLAVACRPSDDVADLLPRDAAQVHLVGAVGEPEGAGTGPHAGERGGLGDAHAAVHLDRAVEHRQRDAGRDDLDGRDLGAGSLGTDVVDQPGRLQRQQARLLDLEPRLRDLLLDD